MTSRSPFLPIPTAGHVLGVVLLGVLLATPLSAQQTERIPVTEIKPLLVLAAEHGTAHGVLIGPGSDYMHRRFEATTPIEIDVSTLHPLPQPGCVRLEVTTRQRDVFEQGQRGDQELRWQVSFCRDGSFPGER